uniref:Uncharacterized protein n=1 Tax=Eimeria tenella TaxID=5802 RepID=H9B8Z5_EIMTE|nr:hypothetical protein [Eimeria tenella]
MSHLHFGRAVPIIFRRFPPLICRDLLGKTVKVPQDLKGQLNLLVVGFKASHYKDMDSWISFARTLKKDLVKRRNIDDSQIETYRLVIRSEGNICMSNQHPLFSYTNYTRCLPSDCSWLLRHLCMHKYGLTHAVLDCTLCSGTQAVCCSAGGLTRDYASQ